MRYIIALCGILVVVSGKPTTDVIPTSTLPTTMSPKIFVTQDTPSSTLLPSTEEPNSSGATEEPRDNTEVPPDPSTDEFPVPQSADTPPWFRLGPGSKFMYHIPISPETDFGPEFWRFRDRPFLQTRSEIVPFFPYKKGKPRNLPQDEADQENTPSENNPAVTEVEAEMKPEPRTLEEEKQEFQAQDGSETEMTEAPEAKANDQSLNFKGMDAYPGGPPMRMIPFIPTLRLLPFGEDRPSFRNLPPYAGIEQRRDMLEPQDTEEEGQPKRFMAFGEQPEVLPQEDDRFVGMIPMEEMSQQPEENDEREPEMIPPNESRDQAPPNEEPEEMPRQEEEQKTDEEPQEEEQQAHEQAPSEMASVKSQEPEDRSMKEEETREENKENVNNPPEEQEQPVPSDMNEEGQEPPNQEEQKMMQEEEEEEKRLQLPEDEMSMNPMMQSQQNFDNSRWFDDPRPFDTNFEGDLPMNNMVENELEVMRGNYDGSFA